MPVWKKVKRKKEKKKEEVFRVLKGGKKCEQRESLKYVT